MRRQASVITLVLLLVAVLACSASSQTRDVTWDFSGRNWMAPTTGGMAGDSLTWSDSWVYHVGDSVLALDWNKGGGSVDFNVESFKSPQNSYETFDVTAKLWCTPNVSLSVVPPAGVYDVTINTPTVVQTKDPCNDGFWEVVQWTGTITPNPTQESFDWQIKPTGLLPGTLLLNSVNIQTDCITTAVPEPSVLLAACAILSPVGFVFRRRKA